ncbi:MAG: MFS transporter [Eubacterium sp.]|nr:MFS transporter [Eubacterium sp.]
MAVSALGGRVDAKNSDNVEKAFNSNDTAYVYYLVMRDADGNPTSMNTEVPNAVINTTISGVARAFESNTDSETDESYLVFSDSNTDYTIKIGNVELKKETGDCSVELAMDSADDGKAALAVYVSPEAYEKITSSGDYTTTLEMHSTIEVERLGFKWFSVIVGVLFILFILVTCLCIKEKSTVDMETVGVGQMFKALIKNDQAMTIVVTIVLINTALYITSNLLIYFFKYDLGGSNWQGNYTLFNTFSGTAQILAMMLMFPLLRKAFTSLKIFYICAVGEIIGYVILLTMALSGVTNVFMFFVPGFFVMAGVGILNVVVTVFLANTVDYGELKNNRRDESVIFSMQTFVVKLASGLAALVASVCLTVFNIQNDGAMNYQALVNKVSNIGNTQSLGDGSLIGLRIVMTIGPTILLIVALLLFRAKYILTDEKLNEISDELKSRKGGSKNV